MDSQKMRKKKKSVHTRTPVMLAMQRRRSGKNFATLSCA